MSSEEFNMMDAEMDAAPAAAPPSFPGPSSRPRRESVLRGNLGLMVMFAAGLGSVYLLSLRNGPMKASAEQETAEGQVDDALHRMTHVDPRQSRAKEVVEPFYLQTRQRQIPLDCLTGNPFVFRQAVTVQTPATGPAETAAAAPKENREEAEVLAETRPWSVQSILTGSSGNSAIINNNLLTEGQKLGSWTVHKIESDRVILTWRGREHVLRLSK